MPSCIYQQDQIACTTFENSHFLPEFESKFVSQTESNNTSNNYNMSLIQQHIEISDEKSYAELSNMNQVSIVETNAIFYTNQLQQEPTQDSTSSEQKSYAMLASFNEQEFSPRLDHVVSTVGGPQYVVTVFNVSDIKLEGSQPQVMYLPQDNSVSNNATNSIGYSNQVNQCMLLMPSSGVISNNTSCITYENVLTSAPKTTVITKSVNQCSVLTNSNADNSMPSSEYPYANGQCQLTTNETKKRCAEDDLKSKLIRLKWGCSTSVFIRSKPDFSILLNDLIK